MMVLSSSVTMVKSDTCITSVFAGMTASSFGRMLKESRLPCTCGSDADRNVVWPLSMSTAVVPI